MLQHTADRQRLYTGDAVDNRAITIGFQPDEVIVKADTAQIAIAAPSMTVYVSKP